MATTDIKHSASRC